MDSTRTKFFCEENYVEENNELKELTVTITLGEYRNLIKQQATMESMIESFSKENCELRCENECYRECIFAEHPESKSNLSGFVQERLNEINKKSKVV